MGKLKDWLPENIDISEPPYTDLTMHDLLRTTHELEMNLPYGYSKELDETISRLGKVYDKVSKDE